MKAIYFFIVLYVSTMSQAFAGTSIKINHAAINTTDETLILHGINFDYFGPLDVRIGDILLTDACVVTSTQVQCSLTGTPVLSGGTWVVNVTAGNAPSKNADIDAYISTDHAIQCPTGSFVSCYSGDSNTIDIGECKSGTSSCLADGSWSSCQGETLPVEEVCDDGLDNNCDGVIDENCLCADPSECDDAVSCTVDSCDSILGCINTPDNSLCNDGIACTVNTCNSMLGCTSEISDGSCLIDGQCYDNGFSDGSICKVCDSNANSTGWTYTPAGTVCDVLPGSVCDGSGNCVTGY